MNVNLLSKYRKELLGLAMIWIAIRHSYFPFTNKAINFVLSECGYGGVDMFLFLSSFGLYYSYKKHSNYMAFMKRRFIRILPYSMSIVIILFALGQKTLKDTIIDFFGLSIWLKPSLDFWFLSLLLFFYLLTPLFLSLFNKKPLVTTVASILIVCLICYLLPEYRLVYIFFRSNVFIMGFVFAYLNEHKNQINCWPFLFISIFGWGLMYVYYHTFGTDILHVLPLLFIIPGQTIFAGWLIDKIKLLQKFLSFISDYTLQFYLVHEPILKVAYDNYGLFYKPGIHFDWIYNFVIILLAFGVAVIYKKLGDNIIEYVRKKLKGA